jgi:hypothetical protein
MELTDIDVIRRVMGQTHLDAERLLAALVGTLVEEHLQLEDPPAPPPDVAGRIGRNRDTGNLKPIGSDGTLQDVIDLLLSARVRNEDFAQAHHRDDEPDDGRFMDGILCGTRAYEQAALLDILYACRTLGEQQAQMARDEAELLREDGTTPAPAASSATAPSAAPDPNPPKLRLRRE